MLDIITHIIYTIFVLIIYKEGITMNQTQGASDISLSYDDYISLRKRNNLLKNDVKDILGVAEKTITNYQTKGFPLVAALALQFYEDNKDNLESIDLTMDRNKFEEWLIIKGFSKIEIGQKTGYGASGIHTMCAKNKFEKRFVMAIMQVAKLENRTDSLQNYK